MIGCVEVPSAIGIKFSSVGDNNVRKKRPCLRHFIHFSRFENISSYLKLKTIIKNMAIDYINTASFSGDERKTFGGTMCRGCFR